MYNNVAVKNGMFGYNVYDDKGKLKYFDEKGKAVMLEEVFRSIETGEITWRVSFDYLGRQCCFNVPRASITEKKSASFLQGKGADITAKTFHCFVDSMRLQEDCLSTVTNVYQRLGWIKIPNNGKLDYAYRCGELIGSVSGKYEGNLVLSPQGTFEEWLSMVKNEILGRPQLETILLAALSAPIVGMYGINATTDNPIYHINFSSGKGKSTVCYLAASVSGEPFDGMRKAYDQDGMAENKISIYGSWGATAKATITAHAGNRGVVAILNELGKFNGGDMTTTVFNLSEGSDIKRLNTQLQASVTEGFNTVFISCGEMSLIDRCKAKLEGIRTRVLEISVPMTEDAEHSRRIKDCCVKNNGHAAPMLAQYILENGDYQMVERSYKETLQELTTSAPQGISGRFIEKFPVFLVMAAKMAENALGISFHTQDVVSFCYDCVTALEVEEGEVCRSYVEILEEFNIQEQNFFDDENREHIPKTAWGRIRHHSPTKNNKLPSKEYYVFPTLLRDMLTKKGFPNPETELKIWRDKGVLECEGKHLTKKVSIKHGEPSKRAYVIQVWEETPPKTAKGIHSKILLAANSDDEETEENNYDNANS